MKPFDVIIRSLMSGFRLTLRRAPARPLSGRPVRLMLTGSFASDKAPAAGAKWLRTHLTPMAMCSRVDEVVFVGPSEGPPIDGVRYLAPPPWLARLLGSSISRLVYFAVSAIRERPDYLGGFHLELNGLAAIWLARLLRSRSIYISTGGPVEVIDGGVGTENALFRRLSGPDRQIESDLVYAAGSADVIIVKGESGREWFSTRCPESVVGTIPGAFPMLKAAECPKVFDLITVARMYPVKRIDRLLEMLALLRQRGMPLTLAIVGDGPDRDDLEELADNLGIRDLVTFAGWQSDVDSWLAQSRVFVLTSDSEGLSQAVVQALLQGLPSITSAVGDLGHVVKPGDNGMLVEDLTPEAFADAVEELFSDPARLERYAANARPSVDYLSVEGMADRWRDILDEVGKNRGDPESVIAVRDARHE